MLYISRIIDTQVQNVSSDTYCNYAIVDTDDGVEEVVDWNTLCYICSDLFMSIEGVTVDGIDGIVYIDFVKPVQEPGVSIDLQTKTQMLKRVTVTTYKSYITSIRCNFFDVTTPVSLRLSDFGKICADRLFYFRGAKIEHPITIILDDNVSFGPCSFKTFEPLMTSDLAVSFDIREITRDSVAEIIYKFVRENDLYDGHPLETVVIDREDRLWYMSQRIFD